MNYYRLLRPLLFALPAETAHHLALHTLRSGLLPSSRPPAAQSLRMNVFGLHFPTPIGLAAGFDKNATALDALLAQGFGFVEAGTVTPLPQEGNPRPRLFRLSEDRAVINRMGFNNAGLEVFVRNLRSRRRSGIVGANIGKNRDSADAVADYVTGLRAVAPHVDYVTVNISSPNTAGLRALQEREALDALLSALVQERGTLAAPVPMLLKIAPDMDDAQLQAIAEVAQSHALDGIIVSNTTLARPESLRSPHRTESGGLSGAPLFAPSTEILRRLYRLTQGRLPLIGVGGIASGADAYEKIRAGATLVQVYSALVYEGFGLVARIQNELAQRLERDGFTHLSQAVGKDA